MLCKRCKVPLTKTNCILYRRGWICFMNTCCWNWNITQEITDKPCQTGIFYLQANVFKIPLCVYKKYNVSNKLLTNSYHIFSSNFLIARKNSRWQLKRFGCHPSLKLQQLWLCHQKILNLRFILNTCEQYSMASVPIGGKRKLVKLEAHLRQYGCVYFLLTNSAYPITNIMPTPFHFIHKFYNFVLN